MKKIQGFTLIELLVTVTIISVLLTIGVASYEKLIKDARDATRQSDLKIIQSALEQYKSDQNFYPSAITPGAALTNRIGRPAPDLLTPTPVLRTYLQKVPQDPQYDPSTYQNYLYVARPITPAACDNTASGFCTNYCLFTNVENDNNRSDVLNCRNDNYDYEVEAP